MIYHQKNVDLYSYFTLLYTKGHVNIFQGLRGPEKEMFKKP